MLRVLLAAGEPETAKALGNYIGVYTQECEVVPVSDSSRVYAAAEGSEAPTLLIADMDILPGPVSLTKRLAEQLPAVKVILYAAIGSSGLLQQCMQNDILDYMYKPLKQSEFLRCLQRALDHFKDIDRRKQEEEQISEAFEAERGGYAKLFLRTVLEGRVYENDAIADGLKFFKIDIEPDFLVFTAELDRRADRHESLFLMFRIKQLIEESLRAGEQGGAGFHIFSDGLNAVTVLLHGKRRQQKVIEECEAIKEQIRERLDARVSIGVGSAYRRPSGISASYREARSALKYREAMGYNSVIPIRVAEPVNSAGYACPAGIENEFTDSVVRGAYESAASALKTVTGALGGGAPIAKTVADILSAVDRRAAERGIDIKRAERFAQSDILALETPSDAHAYLLSAARAICGFISAARSEADASLIRRATDYLKAHYYEKPSAERLAAELETAPEYFERLFEERELMSVYDYAAKIRIAEAKSMMRRTMQDDEVIAVKVGYDDVKQFRGEFREYEGMSVRDFRAGKGGMETV